MSFSAAKCYGQTDGRTDRQSQTNMPPHLLRRSGHNKIKKISKQYSTQQANDRKIYKEVAENLFIDNPNPDPNIKQTIQEKLIEIQNFKNNGNSIRTKK